MADNEQQQGHLSDQDMPTDKNITRHDLFMKMDSMGYLCDGLQMKSNHAFVI